MGDCHLHIQQIYSGCIFASAMDVFMANCINDNKIVSPGKLTSAEFNHVYSISNVLQNCTIYILVSLENTCVMEARIGWMDQTRIIAASRVDQNSLPAQLDISVFKRYIHYSQDLKG